MTRKYHSVFLILALICLLTGMTAQAASGSNVPKISVEELKAMLASDEVKKLLLEAGTEVDYLGPTEFGSFLEEEVTRWASVVKKANIKLE